MYMFKNKLKFLRLQFLSRLLRTSGFRKNGTTASGSAGTSRLRPPWGTGLCTSLFLVIYLNPQTPSGKQHSTSNESLTLAVTFPLRVWRGEEGSCSLKLLASSKSAHSSSAWGYVHHSWRKNAWLQETVSASFVFHREMIVEKTYVCVCISLESKD